MKRILAISLLFIFIAGQVNLTWATHFCGELAVQRTVSIGANDLSCGMEKESCCDEDENGFEGAIITSEECCSNDYYSSDADDFFLKAETESDQLVQFYTLYTISLYKQLHSVDDHSFLTQNIPILIPPDKQVLYQTFLL
jgi:hypothetical protein